MTDISEFVEAGFPLFQLRDAGFTASELIVFFTASELKNVGFSASELKQAGLGLNELIALGYSISELRDNNFTASEMYDANISANVLKVAGYSLDEIITANYSYTEVFSAFPDNISELIRIGYTATILHNLGFSLTELVNNGFSATDIAPIGYSAQELLNANFSLIDLYRANYSASELKSLGYGFNTLLEIGYTLFELKSAGFIIYPSVQTFSIPVQTYGSDNFTITNPESTSNGSWTYISYNSNIATISNGVITIKGKGNCIIQAIQSETDSYNEYTASCILNVVDVSSAAPIRCATNVSFEHFLNTAITYGAIASNIQSHIIESNYAKTITSTTKCAITSV